MVAQVSYHFSSVQLAMRGLLSWFVVQLMPGFSLIVSKLTWCAVLRPLELGCHSGLVVM